jgi:predicted ATPase
VIALHRSLLTLLGGKRQVVLIAGEAGIGKTALLNAFPDQARATHSIASEVIGVLRMQSC